MIDSVTFYMMTLRRRTDGQELITCKLCCQPVSFFCRRCRFNLCDACVPKHLRAKSNTGHDVVVYRNKDDNKELDNTTYKLSAYFNEIIFAIILFIICYVMYQMKVGLEILEDERHNVVDDRVNKTHQEMNHYQNHYETKRQNQERETEEMIRRLEQSVLSVIDSGFPADQNDNRLYDIAVTDDKKVWMRGASSELKLFDTKGNLKRTVTIPSFGYYFCMYNRQVVFTDSRDKAVKKVSDYDTVVTMFTTGDWVPKGITSTASGDVLVCLFKGDQFKVVKYSSTGTVIQAIMYKSQPLRNFPKYMYITENVNGDIIVNWVGKIVTAVDRSGKFRYTYSGKNNDFKPLSVVTDSLGQVMVADFKNNKIHVLNRDGQFLGYIIPEGGIKQPNALAMIRDGEIIVGECITGRAKIIKYLEDKK